MKEPSDGCLQNDECGPSHHPCETACIKNGASMHPPGCNARCSNRFHKTGWLPGIESGFQPHSTPAGPKDKGRDPAFSPAGKEAVRILTGYEVFQPLEERRWGCRLPVYSSPGRQYTHKSECVDNDIPPRQTRTAEVSGRFAGFFCQHLFVNSQTAGVNPRASAAVGLFGLSPLVTKRITVGSGLLPKGTFPVYS